MPKQDEVVKALADKIMRNVQKGYDLNGLRWNYVKQGYSRIEVDKAIVVVNEELERERKLQEQSKQYVFEEEQPVASPVVEEKGFWGKVKGFFVGE